MIRLSAYFTCLKDILECMKCKLQSGKVPTLVEFLFKNTLNLRLTLKCILTN
jgi:hypothetical protein